MPRFKILDFTSATNKTYLTEILKFFSITEKNSLEGTSENHLIQASSPVKAKSKVRSACSEPCPIMYRVSSCTEIS